MTAFTFEPSSCPSVCRTAFNPLVIVAASLVTFAVALATVSYQVLKTARINPVECLRYE